MPSYDDEWFACVSVTREPEQVDAAALVERLRHVRPDLLAEEPAKLDLRDHGAGERPRQRDGVADVVAVAVREEDRVDALRLELRGGAGRVARQERIDVDPISGRACRSGTLRVRAR